jgi:FHS family L-fucose permease-like MFS transporter
MGGGKLGLYAMFGTFFFMSIMFPTIFALAIRGLGDYTKLGASLIVMSIVGGAIAAPFMGHIADTHSMRAGFAVPLVCFVLIALYGAVWQKLEYRDAGTPAGSPAVKFGTH